ncbi:hypothetical protein AURDEDRAFT_157408 [Auricularia subglabra TFB-10046 SS5]|nr:hypothetical protein AURDEDRAFT_157408 [Auricularia subglabra TFB-10046 SS5]
MYSLASTQPHPDFERTLATIRAGGPKAQSWLRDKEGFAIRALYHPESKIPLAVWRAGKSNSNGVEQKHRNINRDGKHLSMLGGIQLGMQHDTREQRSGEVVISEGIHPRYRPATDGMREERSLVRKVRSDKRKLASDENSAVQGGPSKRARQPSASLPPSPPAIQAHSPCDAASHGSANLDLPVTPLIPTMLVPSQAALFPPPHMINYRFVREVGRQLRECADITNWTPPVALADIGWRAHAALVLDMDVFLRDLAPSQDLPAPPETLFDFSHL